MCGRFALRLEERELMAPNVHQRVAPRRWINRDRYVPRYNVAPRTHGVVLRRDDAPNDSNDTGLASEGTSSLNNDLVLHSMKWGLVPRWSKYEDKNLSTMNARSENLVDGAGGMWKSLKGRRCAVMCQGYYEWQTKGKKKIPYFAKHKSHSIMLFAGLWDVVTLEGETEPLYSYTIVTTEASKSFEWLHDRQPAILTSQEELDAWLDPSVQWSKQLEKIIQPYSGPELECYQVPTEVGKVGTESAAYIKPISQRKDGIEAMFGKQRQKASGDSEKKNDTGGQDIADVGGLSNVSPGGVEEEVSVEKPQAVATPTKKREPLAKATPSPQKKRKTKEDESSVKLTSFFPKNIESPQKKRRTNEDESSAKLTSFFAKKE